jgi:hypothetical protein
VGATDARLGISSLSDNRSLKSFLARLECAGQLGKALARRARSLIRACTAHKRVAVCRTSILVYKRMYRHRHLIQPTDRGTVCKLFNVLHEA